MAPWEIIRLTQPYLSFHGDPISPDDGEQTLLAKMSNLSMPHGHHIILPLGPLIRASPFRQGQIPIKAADCQVAIQNHSPHYPLYLLKFPRASFDRHDKKSTPGLTHNISTASSAFFVAGVGPARHTVSLSWLYRILTV